jgi:hypothetical protein
MISIYGLNNARGNAEIKMIASSQQLSSIGGTKSRHSQWVYFGVKKRDGEKFDEVSLNGRLFYFQFAGN